MSHTHAEWMARLVTMDAQHPWWFAQRRAECAILGHDPSGEWFATSHPTHFCWWCASTFKMPAEGSRQ